MNKILSIILLLIVSSLSSQDLKWENSVDGNFTIDSVNVGPNGDVNTVSVSGEAGNWTVYMTYYLQTSFKLKVRENIQLWLGLKMVKKD